MSRIIISLLAVTLIIPLGMADTRTCVTPTACASTHSHEGGPGGDDPCDDGNFAVRSVQVHVEGDVGLWTYFWNACGGGPQADGSHYRYSGIGQGLVVWAPAVGAWGSGAQWQSEDHERPDGSSMRECTLRAYGAVDRACPAGQGPPLVVPALP